MLSVSNWCNQSMDIHIASVLLHLQVTGHRSIPFYITSAFSVLHVPVLSGPTSLCIIDISPARSWRRCFLRWNQRYFQRDLAQNQHCKNAYSKNFCAVEEKVHITLQSSLATYHKKKMSLCIVANLHKKGLHFQQESLDMEWIAKTGLWQTKIFSLNSRYLSITLKYP